MGKKSSRKKQMNHKQGQKKALPTLSQAPVHQTKISEAILHLSESLLFRYREHRLVNSIISLTVIAWNISLFPEKDQANIQTMFLDALPKNITGEDIGELLKNMDILIERKKKDYPNIKELIIKHYLSFEGDKLTLSVDTINIPKEI